MYENQSYFDLVLSFFNQYIFQDAKSNINELKTFFTYEASTSGNAFIALLLDAIKNNTLSNIDIPMFESIMLRTGKTPEESKVIMDKIRRYKFFTKEQIEPARELLRDLVAQVYIRKARHLYESSPSGYLNYLKQVEFKTSGEDYLNSVPFDRVDMNTIVADMDTAKLTSSFGFINRCFTEEAYKDGDIIVISAPPSVGKSLIAETEALHMVLEHKVPVHVLVMGDLDMSALILRFASIYSGRPFSEARRDIVDIYRKMCNDIGDLLDITIAPAGVITAKEYVQYIINSPKHYKACFIDYDENFAIDYTGGGGGMYSEFSSIYNEFTKLKDKGILTEVLCQPKVYTWASDSETIELGDLGTSSRKGHIADVVITVKKLPRSLNGLCIFNLCKNRHGIATKIYTIRLNNGRFIEIPRALFQEIASYQDYRNYTEGEIQRMASSYEIQNKQLQSDIDKRAKGFTPSGPSGPMIKNTEMPWGKNP